MRLQGKVAVITGSAGGIGKSIAETFASEGANIVISDINAEAALKTAEEIKTKYNVETMSAVCDVAKLEECETLIKAALDKFSKIDILTNNAGITKDNLVLTMTEAQWDAVIAVNLKGVFNCIKAVSKSMLKARQGRIINIASVAGQMGNAGQINYSATKGGVIAMTKTCAREFASRNILVNAIAPGFIRTAMTDKLTEEKKKVISSTIPLARLGEVSDIAKAALFFASDDSSYITGHVLAVNGGMYM
ncbi:MAG: 3-oxoacyl-[acyl-carrier-protein] reductase [Christensenellaceae bacterium]|jgi:3-oxoacyl-[acyl-carrier protein] reductase|nr:3-oxoacyl-[acyl-carrier-protein] reductase [Christensenellaceae bacterium]